MPGKDKTELRAFFLAERKKHGAAAIAAMENALSKNILEFFRTRALGLWAAYRGLPNEASMDLAIPLLEIKGMEFCFPRVMNPQIGTMDFFRVTDWKRDFERHKWGMLEPKANCQIIAREKIIGAFIPLLAFDAEGTRLGKGKAFYDRYLENFSGRKIGIAFDWQFSKEAIPRESHDVSLDAVVTDKRIYRF